MSLPVTPPLVIAALLLPASLPADLSAPPAPAQPAVAVSVASTPDVDAAPCPAYLGPQCGSAAHEDWATGQGLAALGLRAA
jgi:hypothetical protein